MEVTRCGVLEPLAFNRSWLPLQDKIEKTLIEVSFPAFSVLRNFDDVLRIRYLKCQPLLAEAWPS